MAGISSSSPTWSWHRERRRPRPHGGPPLLPGHRRRRAGVRAADCVSAPGSTAEAAEDGQALSARVVASGSVIGGQPDIWVADELGGETAEAEPHICLTIWLARLSPSRSNWPRRTPSAASRC